MIEGKLVEVMEAECPTEDALGRFLTLLIEQRAFIDEMFHICVEELAVLLPDLGEKLAVDSKAIQSAGKPAKDEEKRSEPGGRVYCCCPATGKQKEIASFGFEKDRATLKFRCPAAAYGFVCPDRAKCEECAPDGVGPKWEKAYDHRTAVERVNSRIDRVLGFEDHFIRGKAKMEMRVSLALTVLLERQSV